MAEPFESIVSSPLVEVPTIDFSPDNNRQNIRDASNLAGLVDYEVRLDQGARDYESAVAAQALQREQARQNFIDVMKNRNLSMNATLQAYGANQEAIANQLFFNEAGANRAEADARTVLGDRLQSINFAQQELDLTQQQQGIQRAAEIANLQVRNFQASQEQQFALEDAQNQENYALRASGIARETADKSAYFREIAANQGREFAITDAQNEENFALRSAALSREAADLRLDFQKTAADQQRDFTLDEAQEEENFALRAAALNRQTGDVRANFELQQRRNKAAFDTQQMLLQKVVNLGQSAARGRMGATAAQSRQSINALAGMQTAQIQQELLGFVTQASVENQLRAQGQRLSIDQAAATKRSKVDRANFQADLTEAQVDMEKRMASEGQQLAIDQAKATRKSKKDRANFNADLVANQAEFDKRINSERQQLAIDQAADTKSSQVDRANTNLQVTQTRSVIAKAQIDLMKEVADNRLAMESEKLGESMISALAGYEQQKERIFLDKFKADAQAYASRMSEPEFADAPKEPFELPEIPYIPPVLPIEQPKGMSMKVEQQTSSLFSKILTIGGMIVGAAAAPLTAGGSIGATAGFLMASGGAAAQTVGSSGWFDYN